MSKKFDEAVDEALDTLFIPGQSYTSKHIDAKQAITTAVRSLVEGVIGEDEDLYFGKPHGINDAFKFDLSASSKNDLRIEQRNRLKAALEGEG